MAFKATDYLILPSDVFHLIRALLRMPLIGWMKLLLLIGGYFFAVHFGADTIDALFVVFLIAMFAYNIDAKISISLALILLVSIVLTMLLGPYVEFINETTWPEAIAVWVYYFLAIGVFKQMKDMFMERGGEEVDDEETSEMARHAVYTSNEDQSFLEHVALADARASDLARSVILPPSRAYALLSKEESREVEVILPLGLGHIVGNDESLHSGYSIIRMGTRIIIRYR